MFPLTEPAGGYIPKKRLQLVVTQSTNCPKHVFLAFEDTRISIFNSRRSYICTIHGPRLDSIYVPTILSVFPGGCQRNAVLSRTFISSIALACITTKPSRKKLKGSWRSLTRSSRPAKRLLLSSFEENFYLRLHRRVLFQIRRGTAERPQAKQTASYGLASETPHAQSDAKVYPTTLTQYVRAGVIHSIDHHSHALQNRSCFSISPQGVLTKHLLGRN